MWEWDKRYFRSGRIDEIPDVTTFASGLVSDGPGMLDISRSILSRYPLQALPLLEWDLSEDAPALFAALRRQGARRGFFLDYPGTDKPATHYRACDLTPETATAIRDQNLFGWETIFVDDRFCSVIAAWYTDFTYLCMRQPMFDTYLAEHPMYLSLECDPSEPPATNLAAAVAGAAKRLADWTGIAPAAEFSPGPRPRR
jgi:hypothetical protein